MASLKHQERQIRQFEKNTWGKTLNNRLRIPEEGQPKKINACNIGSM